MKKRIYFIFLTVLVCSLFFVACDKKNNEPTPTEQPTEEATATPAPTTEPTPKPTQKPTSAPLSEDMKGVPQKDAVVVFEDKFDEDNIEDNYIIKYVDNMLREDAMLVENGKLVMTQGWCALLPDYDYYLGVDHNQYEMTVTYEAQQIVDFAWCSLFVGCRGSLDGNVQIATDNGVFWVAFNGTDKAYVYPGGGGEYPNGSDWSYKYFEISLPEQFVGGTHKITVVDCGDVISYYMNTAEQEYYLIVKVLFEDEELVCYGNDGTEIWRETNMLPEEGSFVLFNHYAKTILEDLVIKGLE